MNGTLPHTTALIELGALHDAPGLDRHAVYDALRAITRAERELAALKISFVERIVELEKRTAKPALVNAVGMSAREAQEAIITATVIRSLPQAGELLREATVSAAHLRALYEHVRSRPGEPDLQAELLRDAAEILPLACVESADQFARTVRDQLVEKHAKTVRERQQATRGLWSSTTAYANALLKAIFNPAEGAEFLQLIDNEVDAEYRAQHPERAEKLGGHNPEAIHTRRLDALLRLVRGKGRSTGRPTAVLLIDEATLQTELVGHGLIPHDDVPGFIRRADLLFAVRDARGTVLKLGRSRRFATELQKLALIIQFGARCSTPGCDAPWWRLRAHHVTRWTDGGRTNIDELKLFCDACHGHHHQTTDPPKHLQQRANAIANRKTKRNKGSPTPKRANDSPQSTGTPTKPTRTNDSPQSSRPRTRATHAPFGDAPPLPT